MKEVKTRHHRSSPKNVKAAFGGDGKEQSSFVASQEEYVFGMVLEYEFCPADPRS